MKAKINKILLFSVIGIILLVFGTYFFLFTNIGYGLIAAYDNWKQGDPLVPLKNEIVIPPNSTITAETEAGKITIKSGEGIKRYYTWDGTTRSVVMWPRSTRWYGSFGIYYPGPGSHWLPKHNGISRGVLEEGKQHFDTYEEATSWLNKNCRNCVYNDDGLVVCFSKNLSREQINVDVWQIYVGGDTPSQYQESDFHAESAKIFGQPLEEKEVEQIYGGRKSRIYHTGGSKPTKLEGTKNNLIKASWDK